MRIRTVRKGRRRRSGAAAMELALLLPTFAYIGAMGSDYSRLFYSLAILSDSARAGAVYSATHAGASSSAIQAVVLADAADLSPPPSVLSTTGTDSSGNATVSVTVTWTFHTLTANPGIPSSKVLSRTVVMMANPS